MFKVGQEVIAITDAIPINISGISLVLKYTLAKGTRVVVKSIHDNARQHNAVLVVEGGGGSYLPVAYWGSAFKAVISANKIWKELNE
jgi:hypothetical protein